MNCGVSVRADAPLSFCLEYSLSFLAVERLVSLHFLYVTFCRKLSVCRISSVYLSCPDIAQKVWSSGTWGHRVSSCTAGSGAGLLHCVCWGAVLYVFSGVPWCSCTAVFCIALQNAQGVGTYLTFLSSKHGVILQSKRPKF